VALIIDIELYGEIRRLGILGLSQRKIAEKLGIHRDTVAKYSDGAYIPGTGEPSAPQESIDKAEIKAAMREYYEAHIDDQTKKHKINAHIIWRDLHYQYPRHEATYRRYWAEIRGERQVETRMPLIFKIAEAAQADWKQMKVRFHMVEFTLHILCVTYMYSYAFFMKAYPNEKRYNLIDGLISAMEYFGGAVDRFILDNAATARKKGYGKNAELTDEFKLFAAHYGVKIEFTNSYGAPEKGGVEVAAKTAGGILTPVRNVESIHEVNDILLLECQHHLGHAGPIGNRPGAVKEMTEEERPFLTRLPIKRYEVGVHKTAKVNNQQLFEYDSHIYSAPRLYAGKRIGIIGYPYHVELFYAGNKIWECDRPIFEGENRVYAEHYMYDLEIKPRSRENAFPLLEGILPPALNNFRKLCKSKINKCWQLYMLMHKMEDVGRDELLNAVDAANATGNPTFEMVEQILCAEKNTAVSEEEDENTKSATPDDEFYVEQRDFSDYDIFGDGK